MPTNSSLIYGAPYVQGCHLPVSIEEKLIRAADLVRWTGVPKVWSTVGDVGVAVQVTVAGTLPQFGRLNSVDIHCRDERSVASFLEKALWITLLRQDLKSGPRFCCNLLRPSAREKGRERKENL